MIKIPKILFDNIHLINKCIEAVCVNCSEYTVKPCARQKLNKMNIRLFFNNIIYKDIRYEHSNLIKSYSKYKKIQSIRKRLNKI